jgi:STE24 endopeptidase
MNTSELLLLGIVTFILIDFGAGRVIDFLNESNKNVALTGVSAEIYNPDEYAKSLEYGTAKYKVELLTSVITTVVMLSAIILGWFAWLDQVIRDRYNSDFLWSTDTGFHARNSSYFLLLNLCYRRKVWL